MVSSVSTFWDILSSLNPWWVGVGLNTILLSIAIALPKKLLTPAGLAHAWVLGVLIWGCLQWQGYVVVLFYFFVGSAITRLGMKQKEAAGIAEKRSGARGPENVWGAAFTATICAIGIGTIETLPTPGNWQWLVSVLLLGYVASFSTKLSDTCASEFGKVYGKRTFLITTLQPVPKGTEGAVSLEGTIAGMVASAAIAILAWGLSLVSMVGVVWCIVAAFTATNLESVIGAIWQEKIPWLTNELVNVINTSMGAIAAMLLAGAWQAIAFQ